MVHQFPLHRYFHFRFSPYSAQKNLLLHKNIQMLSEASGILLSYIPEPSDLESSDLSDKQDYCQAIHHKAVMLHILLSVHRHRSLYPEPYLQVAFYQDGFAP